MSRSAPEIVDVNLRGDINSAGHFLRVMGGELVAHSFSAGNVGEVTVFTTRPEEQRGLFAARRNGQPDAAVTRCMALAVAGKCVQEIQGDLVEGDVSYLGIMPRETVMERAAEAQSNALVLANARLAEA